VHILDVRPRPSANPDYASRAFGVTQVVDGNWGVHDLIRKNLFAAEVA
jgi:hypothetical protein